MRARCIGDLGFGRGEAPADFAAVGHRPRALALCWKRGVLHMAVNKPKGDGKRIGAVKKRTQLKTKIEGEEHWTKRSKETGQFMDQKKDDSKFKGVRKEA
jgi:hypothetical protein